MRQFILSKLYFVTAVLFAIILTVLALQDDLATRMILVVPVLVLFFGTLILFSLGYDQLSSVSFKQRGEKVKEEAYIKFVKDYYNGKKDTK
ncbi:MAG: hypothetical protein ABIH34_05550 [Nanoarchaeota archaeon]